MSPVRPQLVVVGRRLVGEDHRLRDFLTRIAQPFDWLEAGTPEAEALLETRGIAGAQPPLVLEADGTVHERATVERLAEAWLMSGEPVRARYDLAIVGAGPAGLAAAVYASSDGLATLVVDRDVPGGQASHTSLIENFFGFPDGIPGAELARRAGRQAEKFEAELILMRGVTSSWREPGGPFVLEVDGGHRVEAPVVIAAPGMVWRRLEADGVDGLVGRGIYYGAGRSEARQCRGRDVVVVGAGNSAGQAVTHLADHGARVRMLVRGGALDSSMSAYLVQRIERHPGIEVRLLTRVEGVEDAGGELSAVLVRDAGGRRERLPAAAMFLCLGGVPRTAWAPERGVALDAAGYILTGPDLLREGGRPRNWPLDRDPLPLETSVPGLFAAGDVRHGSTKRVAGAVGEGAMAVALAHRRLAELRP